MKYLKFFLIMIVICVTVSCKDNNQTISNSNSTITNNITSTTIKPYYKSLDNTIISIVNEKNPEPIVSNSGGNIVHLTSEIIEDEYYDYEESITINLECGRYSTIDFIYKNVKNNNGNFILKSEGYIKMPAASYLLRFLDNDNVIFNNNVEVYGYNLDGDNATLHYIEPIEGSYNIYILAEYTYYLFINISSSEQNLGSLFFWS